MYIILQLEISKMKQIIKHVVEINLDIQYTPYFSKKYVQYALFIGLASRCLDIIKSTILLIQNLKKSTSKNHNSS